MSHVIGELSLFCKSKRMEKAKRCLTIRERMNNINPEANYKQSIKGLIAKAHNDMRQVTKFMMYIFSHTLIV